MFRIFGPPGTGKTTRLLDMVDKALAEGVQPHQIAFLAFTKKAAREARERASERFDLNAKEDLAFFQTLHSFGKRITGLRNENLMGDDHYRELSTHIGVELNVRVNEEEERVSSQHPILDLLHKARARKVSVRRQYDQSELMMSWTEVSYITTAFNNYKAVNGLYDFTDMLELFIKYGAQQCPYFKLVFLDEAQDLSPLQWDVAHILEEHSDRMFAAGDDDQAIFRWNGADVEHLINLPGSSDTLSKSYRVPHRVHALAETLTKRISHRFPKVYEPRDAPGAIEHLYDLSNLNMDHGSWLILAQANYMLSPIDAELKTMGLLFERNHKSSIKERVAEAVNGWEQLRKDREVPLHTVEAVYSFMSGNGGRIARGHKKIAASDEELFTLKKLRESHGLLIGADLIWHDALDKLPPLDRQYIIAFLRKGERFNAKPRIQLNTIHQSKGGEADNVVLFSDISPAAARDIGDDLHRLFYVAVTRTRNTLYLVGCENYNLSYPLYE